MVVHLPPATPRRCPTRTPTSSLTAGRRSTAAGRRPATPRRCPARLPTSSPEVGRPSAAAGRPSLPWVLAGIPWAMVKYSFVVWPRYLRLPQQQPAAPPASPGTVSMVLGVFWPAVSILAVSRPCLSDSAPDPESACIRPFLSFGHKSPGTREMRRFSFRRILDLVVITD